MAVRVLTVVPIVSVGTVLTIVTLGTEFTVVTALTVMAVLTKVTNMIALVIVISFNINSNDNSDSRDSIDSSVWCWLSQRFNFTQFVCLSWDSILKALCLLLNQNTAYNFLTCADGSTNTKVSKYFGYFLRLRKLVISLKYEISVLEFLRF